MKENNTEAKLGLVISYFGNSVAVEADDGQVFHCHLRRNQALPLVGDRVTFLAETGETGTISGILPRRSVVSRGEMRGDGQGKAKPIAANIDLLVIVMAPAPVFSPHLLDRYLVAAELLGIQPVIVLNKMDLLEQAGKQAAEQALAVYRHIPYPVVYSSVYLEGELRGLSEVLKEHSAILVGPSGVGKSSIIMALGGEAIRVTAVSAKGAGKHTTTATRLYHLPNGGSLIDSPGVREFNLWPLQQKEVLRGFKEFQAYLTGCKFRDCVHMAEPGCKVQAALADGKIAPERYASYQTLMKQASSK